MEEEHNLYLVTGNDDARIGAEALRLFKSFAGENPDPFGCDVFEEGDAGPGADIIYALIRSLKTPSFFGQSRKVVWLKHYSGFDKEGDRKSASPDAVALRELAELLKAGLSSDMLLIMDGTGLDKRKALYKACHDNGKVMELNRPDISKRGWENEMLACIREAAALKHVGIAPDAEQSLLDALGSDTARIDQELEKIICYRGADGGTVTRDEVEAVCVGKGEEMAWAIANVLGRRDLNEALRIVDVLISQNSGNDEYARAMLNGCAGFFRQAIRICVFMAERKIRTPVALKNIVYAMSNEEKAECRARGMDFIDFHPFRVQNLADETANYSPYEIIDALRVFRDAMWQCMSSSISPRMALESALMQVIGTSRRQYYR